MIIVGNGLLITLGGQNRVIPGGAVVIDGKLIAEVGDTPVLREKYPQARFIDAEGKVIMPGMTNTHMHLYSTFARGMALKDEPPGDFAQILERLWWRLDKVLGMEDVYYSALVPLIDCVKNGTTTIVDHHASPNAITGSLSTIARAAGEIGVRSCLCYEVSDRDGMDKAQEGIDENVRFIEACRNEGDDMLTGCMGLHASLTLSDATLQAAAAAAEKLGAGCHIHTAEGIQDVEDSMRKSGVRVVERLQRFGILGPRSIAAHCVHVNDREIAILKETGTNVAHNPESNMGNAVGCAPVLRMLGQGVRVGMGTDGFTTDMFEGIKVANVLHKFHQADPSAAWAEVPQMIFGNNPAILSGFFPGKLGVLEPGAYADLLIVDYDPPTPLDEMNYYGHVLFGFSGGQVETTIVNGKVLMLNRVLQTVDEKAVRARARVLARKLWERF